MSSGNVPDITDQVVHGGDIYRNRVRLDFSVNLNPLPVPAEVIAGMIEGIEGTGCYPDPFQYALRSSIAGYEHTHIDNIVCGNGASELLMAAVHAGMPSSALITAPCYAGYARALAASGAEITEYFTDESRGFALDEGILGVIDNNYDMVIIADPNNPDGRSIDPDLRKSIAARCEATGAMLIFDECFMPMTRTGITSAACDDRALHLRAFTKSFSVPGVRIGYMVSNDIGMLDKIRLHLPEWNVSGIAERTGTAAAKLASETDFLERSVRVIETERAYLSTELEKCGFKVYSSDTDYLLIRGRRDLYDILLRSGILIRRCSNFSGLDDSYFRIAVRNHNDNEELIRVIREI